MPVYLARARARADLARIAIAEFEAHILRAAGTFRGDVVSLSQPDTLVLFETVANAAQAAVLVVGRMEAETHHKDRMFNETRARVPLAVVDLVPTVLKKSRNGRAATVLHSPTQLLSEKVRCRVATGVVELPAIVMPTPAARHVQTPGLRAEALARDPFLSVVVNVGTDALSMKSTSASGDATDFLVEQGAGEPSFAVDLEYVAVQLPPNSLSASASASAATGLSGPPSPGAMRPVLSGPVGDPSQQHVALMPPPPGTSRSFDYSAASTRSREDNRRASVVSLSRTFSAVQALGSRLASVAGLGAAFVPHHLVARTYSHNLQSHFSRSDMTPTGNDASVMSPDRIEDEIQAIWKRFDVDGNGMLDKDEMNLMFQELGLNLTQEERERFFHATDTDGTGEITMDEFRKQFYENPSIGGGYAMHGVRSMASKLIGDDPHGQLQVIDTLWKKYDPDGNGSLDFHSMCSLMRDMGFKQSTEQLHLMFKKMDDSGNGLVEFHEFLSLFTDDAVMTKMEIARDRAQLVTRTLELKQSKHVFRSNAQRDEDARDEAAAIVMFVLNPILFLYIVYNFSNTFYRLGMASLITVNSTHIATDMVIDAVYIFWFVLKLTILPRYDHGQRIDSAQATIADYALTMEFFVDVLVVLPLDFIFIGLGAARGGLVAYFRMNKILAMYHLRPGDDGLLALLLRSLRPTLVGAVVIGFWFICSAHVVACAVMLVARFISDPASVNGWIGTTNFPHDRQTSYLQALLYGIQALAGQMRGEPLASHDAQVLLNLLAVFVGVPMLASLLSAIAQAVSTNTSESRFLATIEQLRSFFLLQVERASARVRR